MIIDPEAHLSAKGYIYEGMDCGFKIWANGPKWALTFTDPALFNGGIIPRKIRERAANTLHNITDVFYHGDVRLGTLPDGQNALGLGTGLNSPRWHDLRALGNIFQGEIKWVWNQAEFPPIIGGSCLFWPEPWFRKTWNLLPDGTEGAYRTGGHALAFELFVPTNPYKEHYRISLVKNAHARSREVAQIEEAVNAGILCKWHDGGEDTYALCKWERPDRPNVEHLGARVASWRRLCNNLFAANAAYSRESFIDKWLSLAINAEAVRCLINYPVSSPIKPTSPNRLPTNPVPQPHDSWARVYDKVYESIFGPLYKALTRQTLEVIQAKIPSPAKVVDFGAGTGRLSIPLCELGYTVESVEPSQAMCDVLRNKAGSRFGNRLVVHQATASDYTTTEPADLALCVFTVILYLTDRQALEDAFRVISASLKPGGYLLIDIPTLALFRSMNVVNHDVRREVQIVQDPANQNVYSYTDFMEVDGVEYRDEFRICYWPRKTVEDVLLKFGLQPEPDIGLITKFRSTGSEYLWCRKK